MDNATHAFAGLLLADAAVAWIEHRTQRPASRSLRRIAVTLGIVGAELPDADLLYSGPVVGMGKLGYLLHHRGHTHTLVFVLLATMLLWWAARAVRDRSGESATALASERTPLLLLALSATVSHLLLDFTNSYGVHPFWPVDNRWFYGDAVFIVEPWLWVVAIPPLLYGPRRTASRVLLALLLTAILATGPLLGALTPALALGVAACAVIWLLLLRPLSPTRRVSIAIVAWCVAEGTFAVSSQRARGAVQRAMSLDAPDERVYDIALTPSAANANCFDAMVVSTAAGAYHVRSGVVRPWTRTAPSREATCVIGLGDRGSPFGTLSGVRTLASSGESRVTWRSEWSAPTDALRRIAEERCGGAALRFMRIPVWQVESDSSRRLTDARFGFGGGGFAELRSPAGVCALKPNAWIPPWVPPRADVLARER